jgi:hypothetical protein
MAKLENTLQQQIDGLIENAKQNNNSGNYKAALDNLIEAWDLLPLTKQDFSDSYSIIKYIIQLSLRNNDTLTAKQWVMKIYECAKHRIDDGEREYLHGRVEHASKNLNEAKTLFKIAFKKSEGRSPAPREKDFLKLITS